MQVLLTVIQQVDMVMWLMEVTSNL